jgi:Holin of 3TMs, for gene-transfer release
MAEVKKDEDWMQKKWRPAMGWMYMIVCMMDMVIFPVLWSILQAVTHTPITQWNPLTLQGAGLFHLAMGAVLGIAAFGRTQEKLGGAAANAPIPALPASMPTAPSVPAPMPMAPKPVPMAPPPAPSMDLLPDDPPTRNTRND